MNEAQVRQLMVLQVNGRDHEVAVEPRTTLVDVLRHELHLTGTHVGCEHGVCGACTVHLDGSPVRACLVLAAQAEGRAVTTIEGLSGEGVGDDELTDLQQAFSRCHGLQCGFCTPGFVMLAEGFLAEEPEPTREQVREAVSGNLCRCTGYQTIVDAVMSCAQSRCARAEEGELG